jgi:hypothetical protein
MDFAEAIVKAKIEIKQMEDNERNKKYSDTLKGIAGAIYYLKKARKSVEGKNDAKRTTAA